MIGRTYLEHGQPVVVLRRWRYFAYQPSAWPEHLFQTGRTVVAPRNVLIERQDGSRVVRPFRGLRKQPEVTA